jgi:chromodomain-containing protein
MPRYDGPYNIIEAYPNSSVYKLDLPQNSKIHPTFHVSQLRPYSSNDDSLFPGRKLSKPGPIVTEDRHTEYFIDSILDEHHRGNGKQYLVRWKGYGPEADLWISKSDLINIEALESWSKSMERDNFLEAVGV